MADKDKQGTTDSLANFTFDNQEEWFGGNPAVKKEKADEEVIKEVTTDEDDLDDDFPKSTPVAKTTKAAAPAKEDDDSEEDDESSKKKPKTETTKTPAKGDVKAKAETKKAETATGDEDENEEEFFNIKDDKKEPKSKDADKGDEDDDEESEYSTLAKKMAKKGFFSNVEVDEAKEYTEDEFFELAEEEIDKRVDDAFESYFGDMTPAKKALFTHIKDGGDPLEFVARVQSMVPKLDFDELDEDNDKQLEKVVRYQMTKVEGITDEDEITDRIQYLKDGGKLKNFGVKYFEKIKKDEEATKDAVLKQAEEDRKETETKNKAFNKELKDLLESTEAVGSFKFTKADQKVIDTYLTKSTVKIDKNQYIPEFQRDIVKILTAKTPEDKQKLLALAKIVKSNFKVDDLKVTTRTAVVKEAREKLDEAKKTGIKTKSSSGKSTKELSDFFME